MVLATLLVATPSLARLKVLVIVDTEDSTLRSEITSSINARLNSTDRYEATDNPNGADLELDIMCLKIVDQFKRPLGIACDSDGEYYPFKNRAAYPLAGASKMAANDETALRDITNALVDAFINDTTDSKLSEWKARLTGQILEICVAHPNVCRAPLP
jgi:hypothetical protein